MRNLITCARDQGNFLRNAGPRADGTFPEPAVRILTEAGDWLKTKWRSHLRYGSLPTVAPFACNVYAPRQHSLYACPFLAGKRRLALGSSNEGKPVRLLSNSALLRFIQEDWRVHVIGLPAEAPDHPLTTL
ncbi:hypothetical protein [Edaphobacter sp. HDX4]|uniref:hypothetical protein n=1 Tax=Edaphobacter sp. HDX4 TaxID=2794064 RepID=UPI003FA527D7